HIHLYLRESEPLSRFDFFRIKAHQFFFSRHEFICKNHIEFAIIRRIHWIVLPRKSRISKSLWVGANTGLFFKFRKRGLRFVLSGFYMPAEHGIKFLGILLFLLRAKVY